MRLRALMALLLASPAWAQDSLTLYTSLHEQNLPLFIAAFEKKHGTRVNAWRSGSDKVLVRTVTEAQGGRHDVDVVFTGSGELEALHREKLLAPIKSSSHENLAAAGMPAHREWAPVFLNVWIQEYNTKAVRKAELPKTYDDLRDPRWKGRLGIEAGNDDWFGKLLTEMGEQKGLDLFRAIVATNGISVRKGHSLLGNLVLSGEVPFAITMHSNVAELAKKQGKPVDWVALEPVVARANSIGVMRKAPHARAGQLFYEFLLSDEGQRLFASFEYIPASRNVASPLKGVKLHIIDPGVALDQSEKWAKLYDDVIIKRRP